MPRILLHVAGVVQGVGFRPFVYRTALAHDLSGYVQNGRSGVRIEVQGPEIAVESFVASLKRDLPLPGRVESLERQVLPEQAEVGFRIRASSESSRVSPTLPADLATCQDCIDELRSPTERRYEYPFTNCTRCGPRYSIVQALPYDRPRTSMHEFPLCADCEREYRDPLDRRFDAQPIACPRCGPHLELIVGGMRRAVGAAALEDAARELRAGRILALEGLGGFQLLVDAGCDEFVQRLRQRKHRDDKPLAVMFSSLAELRRFAEVDELEAEALSSSAAPILLVRRREGSALANAIAPGNPMLGALLPTTPLHHLLLGAVGRPVVCTSGNMSEEPMCTEPSDALQKLDNVADAFLVHNRRIVRPIDDSVARVVRGRLRLLRRARGYAPLPVARIESSQTLLGVGAHLKSSIALAVGGQVVMSQHLGDLDGPENIALFERTIDDLIRFFDAKVDAIACDLHPDYASTRIAEKLSESWGKPLVRVQHHHAHVAACIAEHGLESPVLGIAWDGSGYGSDGSIWGGEALICRGASFDRFASLRSFPLPGGDRAAREPRRAALGLLHELGGPELALREARRWFSETELATLLRAIAASVNAPRTSSMGRLFDAVAALLGLVSVCSFEGQAAMALEHCAMQACDHEAYPFPLIEGAPRLADWGPLLHAVIDDRQRGVVASVIARRFHNSLVQLALAIAEGAAIGHVALTGGCFQNALLSSELSDRLERRHYEVHEPLEVPPNDGGIALGQVLIAAASEYRRCRSVTTTVT
jgi:hydrogenase maturation protein HypF